MHWLRQTASHLDETNTSCSSPCPRILPIVLCIAALSRSLTDSVTGQPRRRTQRVRIVMLAAPVRRRWPPKSSTHRNSMHRQQCSDKHWRIVPTVRSSWQDQMALENPLSIQSLGSGALKLRHSLLRWKGKEGPTGTFP